VISSRRVYSSGLVIDNARACHDDEPENDLLELITVLLILGAAAAVVAPSLFSGLVRSPLDAAAERAAALLQDARAAAVRSGSPVTVDLSTDGRELRSLPTPCSSSRCCASRRRDRARRGLLSHGLAAGRALDRAQSEGIGRRSSRCPCSAAR